MFIKEDANIRIEHSHVVLYELHNRQKNEGMLLR